MFWLQKIKASALQMVLVISVIILILVFAFISLIYIQKRIQVKNTNYKESVYINQQVFKSLKSLKIPFGITGANNLFSSNYSISTLTKKQWGVFELIRVKTAINKEIFEHVALIGSNNSKRKALYLKDNLQPLIVVGNTTIRGDVSLPSRGVSTGNIAGVSYNKDKMIYGNITQSKKKLPEILTKKNIENFIKGYSNDSIGYFELEENNSKLQSFTKKTLVYKRNGIIDIVNTRLIGNIVIESDTLIRVHASSELEDVILIAPSIEIKSGFKGNLQAFATKNILVKKNSNLSYPTSLVLFDKSAKKTSNDAQIQLSEDSTVKGILGYFTSDKKANYTSQIILKKTSNVVGEIYCLGNIELKGSVYGSIYTNSFIANQSGGIYINNVYNGVINSRKLPLEFSGFSFNNSSKSVAKWVD
jgi:hypothetical protein